MAATKVAAYQTMGLSKLEKFQREHYDTMTDQKEIWEKGGEDASDAFESMFVSEKEEEAQIKKKSGKEKEEKAQQDIDDGEAESESPSVSPTPEDVPLKKKSGKEKEEKAQQDIDDREAESEPPSVSSHMPENVPAKKRSVSPGKKSHSNASSQVPVVVPDKVVYGRSKNTYGENFMRATFYVTPEIFAALNYKTYMDKSKNKSGHVRAALEMYLKNEIKMVRTSQEEEKKEGDL